MAVLWFKLSSERGKPKFTPSENLPAVLLKPSCCASETPTPFAPLKSKKQFFAVPKITEANLSFEERAQLHRIQVFCSLHNGVAISYLSKQTTAKDAGSGIEIQDYTHTHTPQPKTRGPTSV